jgi:hypothetical protein
MNKTPNITKAQQLYTTVMDELDEYDDEQKYHILRYLTNFLESQEADIYKTNNKFNDT